MKVKPLVPGLAALVLGLFCQFARAQEAAPIEIESNTGEEVEQEEPAEDANITSASPEANVDSDSDLDAEANSENQHPPGTKVYSCAIDFPLDSVQFSGEKIDVCFEDIDLKRVTYVHVFATATPTGSMDHNLYLSNRRAGAIEGYIKNKYPNLQVHAFGGGINPKFGKSARIMIVESGLDPSLEPSGPVPTLVQGGELKIKYKYQYKYLTEEKYGFDLRASTGFARFRPAPSNYQFVSLGIAREVYLPYIESLQLGLRYGMHRADAVLDVHTASVTAEKMYPLFRLPGSGGLEAGTQFSIGGTYIDDAEADAGVTGILRYRHEDLSSSFSAGVSRHFQWIGMEIGIFI